MSINPRKGCDPDILDALDVIHDEASSALRGSIIRQAQREIVNLRTQVAIMRNMSGKVEIPVDRLAIVNKRIADRKERADKG